MVISDCFPLVVLTSSNYFAAIATNAIMDYRKTITHEEQENKI